MTNLKMLGQRPEQLFLLIKIIERFCSWLFIHKFSSCIIEIYKD